MCNSNVLLCWSCHSSRGLEHRLPYIRHNKLSDTFGVLQTNNPRKIRVLEQLGVQVTERLPCIVKAQALNMAYLSTKQRRMAHLLTEAAADEQLSAQVQLSHHSPARNSVILPVWCLLCLCMQVASHSQVYKPLLCFAACSFSSLEG